MQKAYSRTNWENYPSDVSPINEANLNNIETGIDEIDNRVISLNTTKATREEVATLVQEVDFNEETGVFTITKKNGSVLKIDTKIEKIAVNFLYDKNTQQIILALIDGTKQYIDLSALITQYEFVDTTTIGFEITSDGKVKATVLDGSISEDKLQPNYLALIKVEVAKAQSSQVEAAASAANAANYAKNAKTSETNAANSASTATSNATEAAKSESNAAKSATSASNSEKSASSSASAAAASAANAADSSSSASSSAASANTAKKSAENSAEEAAVNATAAAASAANAANYANGSTNSAKYYYEQAKSISESFSGALRPMGTVTFINLPAISTVTEGEMYNIANEFTTTSDFKESAGNVVPAGTNVYKTADGKWDILAGTPVTGVKGSAESSYRRGNVNITPANIGLGNVPNVSTNNQTPTYSSSSSLSNLASGETLSVAFGKIAKAVGTLISHIANNDNPHSVTKVQVGLGNVDNTADSDKPISTEVQTALNGKANASHMQSANTITRGMLDGDVLANTTAVTVLSAKQVRNISAGTAALTAGSSSLATGDIYIQYE